MTFDLQLASRKIFVFLFIFFGPQFYSRKNVQSSAYITKN